MCGTIRSPFQNIYSQIRLNTIVTVCRNWRGTRIHELPIPKCVSNPYAYAAHVIIARVLLIVFRTIYNVRQKRFKMIAEEDNPTFRTSILMGNLTVTFASVLPFWFSKKYAKRLPPIDRSNIVTRNLQGIRLDLTFLIVEVVKFCFWPNIRESKSNTYISVLFLSSQPFHGFFEVL